MRVAPLQALFAEARAERAKRNAPPVEETSPKQRAVDELESCETREAMLAWASDNRATLEGVSSDDAVFWRALRDRAVSIGDGSVADEIEASLP